MTSKTKTKCPKCPRYVYDNQNSICCDECLNWFHLRCAGLSAKDFKLICKNPLSTFICNYCLHFKCGKCCKPVFDGQNALCCDVTDCSTWFHLKCTTVSLTDYQLFKNEKKDDLWFCKNCFEPPFANLDSNNLYNYFYPQLLENMPGVASIEFSKTCGVCNIAIKKNHLKKSLPCSSCHSLIHRHKCSNLTTTELISFKLNDFAGWECSVCLAEKFPFADMDTGNILRLTFNSNFNCQCQVSDLLPEERNAILSFTKFKMSDDPKASDGPDPESLLEKAYDMKVNFNYYGAHDFHKLTSNLPKAKNSLSIIHTNIQSLQHNFDNLHTLLTDLDYSFDIVAVSETWNPKDKKFRFSPGVLPGYQPYNGLCGYSLKSGCGMYIKESLNCPNRTDLDISFCDDDNEFQFKWIEIINEKSINILVAVCYRHPKKNSNKEFNNKLKAVVEKLKNEHKIIIIAGDFNYDLLKYSLNEHINTFIEIMFTHFLQPCILEPTRIVAGNKPSLVDNIFINSIEKDIISGNFYSKISDHMPNFVIIQDLITTKSKEKRKVRDFKSFDVENYKRDISNINIAPHLEDNDLDTIYNIFHDQLVEVIDSHAPYKILSKKEMKWSQKPWLSQGIQKSIKVKNSLYRKYVKTKDIFWHARYKYYRNSIKVLIQKSKKFFYTRYFEMHVNNSKKIWKGVNEILHQRSRGSTSQIFLDCNGQIITNQKLVANKFNDFYTNVAHDLVQKLGKPNSKYQDYLKNPNVHSMFLNETEPDEIEEIICNLDISKAGDIYGISPKLIKFASRELVPILVPIFNISFKCGQFPSKLKIAKVIPIHKGDSKLLTCNYRPISLLPIIGKIFEKIMHSRLMSFLTKHNILYDKQYGFQKHKSTEQAIIDMQSKIVEAYENKEKACCIFLDFAKAFDTVNHSILIRKLEHYGIRGSSLNWFASYLTNRQQSVEVGNQISDLQHIDNGVPQGSVLGPLLFLLYINDISDCSSKVTFYLFADDTSIFMSHKDINTLQDKLNAELVHVSDWLIANKLSLNVKKSNALLFRTKNCSSNNQINLEINGSPIVEKDHAKYLGLLIDHKLTFEYHIEHINTKMIKGNALLAKLRHYVPDTVLKNFYNAQIQPHLDYGALVWGTSAQTHISKIAKSHEKSIKIMNFKKKDDLPLPLFKHAKILPLDMNTKFIQGKFIWKLVHGQSTERMQGMFLENGVVQSQRSLWKLLLPCKRTDFGTRFITFSAVKQWNAIPNNIISINRFSYFKKEYKKFLFLSC